MSILNRRTFTALLAGAAAMGGPARARTTGSRIAFYASVGTEMIIYEVDVEGATLTRRGSVMLPANVQYAWAHPSMKFLYIASSKNGPGGGRHADPGNSVGNYANAFRVDPASGALTPHGDAIALPSRPTHISIDHTGRYALVSYSEPANVTVHHVHADGTLGERVAQREKLDTGIYAHQIRATPSNKTVTLVTRGINASPGKPEYPGAIKVFGFHDGQLGNIASIAPADALDFGPRHLDFHPSAPFVYVSLERGNALYVYGLKPDGTLTYAPLFQMSSLIDPQRIHKVQQGGPIHVHPNGRFVYQTNRASGTVDFEGKKVSAGGENNIAVYAIDEKTGKPIPIQHAPAHDFELRTFSIDPSGRLLITASIAPMLVRKGNAIAKVSAALTLYRVGTDGKLAYSRQYDVDTSDGTQWWSGLLTMP